MSKVELIVILIIALTSLISWKGFRSSSFFERYFFETDAILKEKQYYRLVSSGFLHAGWLHLLFNMTVLYSFAHSVGYLFDAGEFALLYFISLVAGNLFALYIHRQHGDYTAIGASGAVSGVLFASIAIFPESRISFMFLPVQMDGWIFGLLYMIITIYGVKTQKSNIGHEAHLGGAIAGIVTTVCLYPILLQIHPYLILALLVPFIVFLTLLIKKPEIMLIENYWGVDLPLNKRKKQDDLPNELELDALLEKVGRKGFQGLSAKEKKKLEEYSKTLK